MNTPLMTLTALALALAAGAPAYAVPPDAASAPAANAVPDNFIGPLAPGQCYASQCPGALAPAEAALDPKMVEQQNLANGTYTYLKQTADGSVIQLKEGGWTTCMTGVCQMPSSLADMAKKCAADAALPANQQKIPQSVRDAVAQAAKDKGDAAALAALGNGGGNKPTGFMALSMPSEKNTPAGPTTTSADTAANDPVTPTVGASNDPTDLGGLGGIIGNNNGDTGTVGANAPNGQTGTPRQDADFNRQSQATIAEINAGVTAGSKIDPGSFGFINTRKAASSPTVGLLQSGTVFTDPKTKGDGTTRTDGAGNTAAFGLGGSK